VIAAVLALLGVDAVSSAERAERSARESLTAHELAEQRLAAELVGFEVDFTATGSDADANRVNLGRLRIERAKGKTNEARAAVTAAETATATARREATEAAALAAERAAAKTEAAIGERYRAAVEDALAAADRAGAALGELRAARETTARARAALVALVPTMAVERAREDATHTAVHLRADLPARAAAAAQRLAVDCGAEVRLAVEAYDLAARSIGGVMALGPVFARVLLEHAATPAPGTLDFDRWLMALDGGGLGAPRVRAGAPDVTPEEAFALVMAMPFNEARTEVDRLAAARGGETWPMREARAEELRVAVRQQNDRARAAGVPMPEIVQ
jgi:hypothetical protein